MNDIEILKDMLISDAQIPLRQEENGPSSVELTDTQANTTVEIKGLPHDSIVIRAEDFEDPLTIFEGSKGERKRADFVIVSNEEAKKWIICIETQARDSKKAAHVEEQLKGAQCFMSYCKCIGRSFWREEHFLDGYQYRFVSMANINFRKKKTGTNPNKKTKRSYAPHIRSKGKLHDIPEVFLKISRSPSLHFRRLIFEAS